MRLSQLGVIAPLLLTLVNCNKQVGTVDDSEIAIGQIKPTAIGGERYSRLSGQVVLIRKNGITSVSVSDLNLYPEDSNSNLISM